MLQVCHDMRAKKLFEPNLAQSFPNPFRAMRWPMTEPKIPTSQIWPSHFGIVPSNAVAKDRAKCGSHMLHHTAAVANAQVITLSRHDHWHSVCR